MIRKGEVSCCWICTTCKDNEYVQDEFTCRACELGWWPDDELAGKMLLFIHSVIHKHHANAYNTIPLGICLTQYDIFAVYGQRLDSSLISAQLCSLCPSHPLQHFLSLALSCLRAPRCFDSSLQRRAELDNGEVGIPLVPSSRVSDSTVSPWNLSSYREFWLPERQTDLR